MSQKTTTQTAGCANFAPSQTAGELTRQFVQTKRQVKKYSGDNDCLDALSYAAGLLSANRDYFDQSKFISLTRAFCDSPEELNTLLNLYSDWVNFLIQNHKLTREFSVDMPLYRFA